jgi:PAS domain S-box-containing protein
MTRTAEQFRLTVEAAPTGMVLVDEQGLIVLVSAPIETLCGYSSEDLVGQPIEMLVPERIRPALRAAFSEDPRGLARNLGGDLFALCKDGSEVPIEMGLSRFRADGVSFVLGSVTDISERRRGEKERERLVAQLQTLNAELEQRVHARTAELVGALRDRELLLQEVQHRVKNNLQVISSLMNMQARSLGGGPGRAALLECRARVQAIALIHDKLYQSRDSERVPFSEYTRQLARDVFSTSGVSPQGIRLELAIQDAALAVDRAIPCGLILNELIANALAHGFPDGRQGTIRVELEPRDGGALRLAVIDDGVGLPASFDAARSSSLGLQLVRTLAEQLGAALEIDGSRGTRVILTFPGEA